MRIYVATSRANFAVAKEWAAKLEARGHTITYAWWKDVEKNGPDEGVEPDELLRCATADRDGVMAADAFWLIAPEHGGVGCWIELGMAIARCDLDGGPIVVVSGAYGRSLFWLLHEVDEAFSYHDDAFAFLNAGYFT